MDRQPVKSPNIASIGYDPSTSTLEVEFNSGNIYQYSNVPEMIFHSLINSESVGKSFNSQVKGKFEYMEVS